MKRSFARVSALFLFAITYCLHVLAQAPVVKQTVIEVPFEFIHGSIVVQATLNGHGPFWMLLDTGADPSIVEIGAAKSVVLKTAASGQQGSGGGTGDNLAYETSLPLVQLGGLTASNVDALAMDLSKLSSPLGRPISGVLGYSLLKTRIVQIDYPSRRVRFFTSAPSCAGAARPHSPRCTTLSFRYQDDILASGVTVDGKPVTTNVDTGSNSNFQLTPAAVNKLGLSEDVARAHASSSVGFNGSLKNREGTVRNVRVGTISVNSEEVTELIRELALVCEDTPIVSILNRLGYRTGKGNTWTEKRVQHVRHTNGFPACPPPDQRLWITMQQAAAALRVSEMVVRRLIAQKILPAKQIVKFAPG